MNFSPPAAPDSDALTVRVPADADAPADAVAPGDAAAEPAAAPAEPASPPVPALSRREAAVLAALLAVFAGLVGLRAWQRAGPDTPPPELPASAPAPLVIDLNTASEEDLQLLATIGPVRARAIVEYRRAHGPFARVEDLRAVSGMGEKTVERLRPWLHVTPEASAP